MLRELIALEDHSKIWVYQSNRDFTYDEIDELRDDIFQFVDQWTSHHQSVLGYGNIFHKRFIALFVDESLASTSGCSIDSSVAFVKSQGQKFGVDFFDRLNFTYLRDEEVHTVRTTKLSDAIKEGSVSEDTLFFDNLVKTKGDFIKSWLKPLKESWHYNFV